MTTAQAISTALVQERGFVPIDSSIDGPLVREWYAFVGVRHYWGSVIACGVIEARGEDQQFVAERSAEFYDFSRSFRPYAGAAVTRLGGFGLVVVVTEGPSSDAFRRFVVSRKYGSAWHQDYCMTWLLDVALREVFTHRGFPLAFFPGGAFFRSVLKRNQPDNLRMERTWPST